MATDRTVTVKSSGGDYASLNAALAGEQGDLVSLDRRLIIECYDLADSTAVNTTGQTWVTDATRYVLVTAATDHAGKYSTSSYRLTGISAAALFTSASGTGLDHLHLQGLQFYYDSTFSNCRAISYLVTAAGWLKVEKCIVVMGNTDAADTETGIYASSSTPDFYIWNTIIYGATNTSSSYGVDFAGSTVDAWLYNVTIDDCYTGLKTAAGRVRCKNTRITGCTAVTTNSVHTDSDYNLTDGAAPTNWGANSIDSTDTPTIDYTDDDNATLTSRDYHLGATDSGIGAGTNLSSDPSLAFTDDIDGESRG